MCWNVRRAAATAIVGIAVSAAAACAEDQPDEEPAVFLPSRTRRDAGKDASSVLEAADTGPPDTGPPPDPFCSEPGLLLCFTFDAAVENLVTTTPKLTPSNVIGIDLVPGKKDKAARLDTGSVVTFAPSPLLAVSTATVEAWVNRDLSTFADDTVFDDDQRFAMTIETDGTLRCTTAAAEARGGKVGIEQWMHVACVFDGTKIAAYVGGAQVASANGAVSSTATMPVAAIGDAAATGGAGFAGEIDSFRVWNVARSAAEISAAARN